MTRRSTPEIGAVFGRYTVLRCVGARAGKTYVEGRCACGVVKEVAFKELKNGKTQSCGCMKREKLRSIQLDKLRRRMGDGIVCPGCERKLPAAAYALDRQKAIGIQGKCRDCMAEYRALALLQQYGVGATPYSSLLAKQGGKCAICGCPPAPGKRLAIDHNHSTGLYRGLLCSNCNVGLGCFGDNPLFLAAAVQYVKSAAGGAS